MQCKTSWRILILFSKSAKEITNSPADYQNELQNFIRIWTLFQEKV